MDETKNQERAIGRVEAGLQAMTETQGRILAGQDEIRKDMEESRRRLHERLEKHEGENNRTFNAINETLSRLTDDYMFKSSEIARMQQNQGERIAGLEGRMSLQEQKARDAKRDWRRVKQVGAVAGASATVLAGDHALGGKIAKFITAIFTGKSG